MGLAGKTASRFARMLTVIADERAGSSESCAYRDSQYGG